MQSNMSNIFNLLENFVDIISNEYGLIIGAKYHSSNMNDVYTMSPYDIVSLPVPHKSQMADHILFEI